MSALHREHFSGHGSHESLKARTTALNGQSKTVAGSVRTQTAKISAGEAFFIVGLEINH
jgi:hypothetical protein